MLGYHNRVLRFDLTKRKWKVEPLNLKWAEQYYGGKGLGMKYLYEEIEPGIDPLSPDNKLILATGPLSGTSTPCNGKLSITTKSPATGLINESSIGGTIVAEIRYAGYDMIILEGKASSPVYIEIVNDHISIRDAENLWGMTSHAAELKLQDEIGHEGATLSVGPAGENMCPMSCINGELFRQAGRGGVGAVMGSKKVKAIHIRGSKYPVKVADMQQFLQKTKDYLHTNVLTEDNDWVIELGTTGLVDATNEGGISPNKNFQDGYNAKTHGLNNEAFLEIREHKKACFGCGLGCGNVIRAGKHFLEGPEYESIILAGPNLDIFDIEFVTEFNVLCDDYGVDTISCADTISYAMEMTEKKIHNFGIKFGQQDKVREYIKLIATAQGVGYELSKGTKWLSEKYGGKDFAMHVKGLELPAYDPRGSFGMSIAYATSDRGGCHMRGWPVAEEVLADGEPYTLEGKAQMTIDMQHYNAVKFSLMICDFWALGYDVMADLMTSALGREITEAELEKAGERIYNLSRMFNCREGFARKDDTCPDRVFKDPLKSGVAEGKFVPREDFEKELSNYYTLRGWNQNGIPMKSKLEELGMEVREKQEKIVYLADLEKASKEVAATQ